MPEEIQSNQPLYSLNLIPNNGSIFFPYILQSTPIKLIYNFPNINPNAVLVFPRFQVLYKAFKHL